MGKIYVGDFGTVLDVDVGEDISAATELKIRATKPDGTTIVEWVSGLQGSSTVRYTFADGDLDTAGVWKLQAKVTNASGVWYGETVPLRIYALFA